jgi:hypothetical protein
MPKTLTKPKTIRLLPFSLDKIFPFSGLTGHESDDVERVNEAYKRLFVELIPGFIDKRVQFVLAEVLEIDRKESTSRILVYSDLEEDARSSLITEYKEIINSLKDDSELIISESDAFYLTSRIWCAETRGIDLTEENERDKEWSFLPGAKITQTPMGVADQIDIKSEEDKIEAIFSRYIEKLYAHHLNKYPFAYVLLVPIFLGSMYGRKESLQKLGAIFLHFASTKQIKRIDLRRIYGRTLLFWHYYFTSEAIDKRQSQLEENIQETKSLKLEVDLYKRIEPFIQQIRDGLQEMHKPLVALELEMNPVRGVLFSGEDLGRFFQTGGPIYIGDGLPEIVPKHDWIGGTDVEVYKTLIAGILIKVFRLENEKTTRGSDFWTEVVKMIIRNADEFSLPLFRELLRSIPQLRLTNPDQAEVKEAFKIIKSWFNDAYKQGANTAGLPITMLDFALRVWGCPINMNDAGLHSFWVASREPRYTLDALGMLHEKHRFHEVALNLEKTRENGRPVTSSTMRIGLALSHKETSNREGSLERLTNSLKDALEEGVKPRGDMANFLWTLSGRRQLILDGTVLNWNDENSAFSVDFIDATGEQKEILISWKGEIKV